MQEAILILENNEIFYGKSVGYIADSYGEIVFNTAMTGYQEVISDPSYKDQIITFTYPHIGNVGVNKEDQESNSSYVSGIVLSEIPSKASNWRSELDFDKPVSDIDKPPFPSAPTYDAKAWKFIREHASRGALFWNVGA